jgi:acetolactate synthase-1/2/3 large subunit
VTGIACSYYDSIPAIYFTGQVQTHEYKGESKQRQVGFQETDIVSVVKPLTKYAVMITNPHDIRYELEKALWMVQSGRPGPVLIDLPMDIQWAEIEARELRAYEPDETRPEDYNSIREKVTVVADWIRKSERPMIISGGGVRNARATDEIKALATLGDIPVAVTFGGVDTFAHDSPLYSGLIGVMGNRATNISLTKSDLVLAVGTRLTLRQVKMKPKDFVPNGKLVHVDIDPNELNQRVPTDLSLACDAKEFLTLLLSELKKDGCPRFSDWRKQTRSSFEKNPFCKLEYYSEKGAVNPYVFMKTLSEQMADDDILIADAGQNVMWAMQAVEVRAQQRLFTDAAHSTMGYSMPAAIGVAVHYKDGSPRVICTIGDGAIQLNIQELQTIRSYNLPVKIFVLNNHSYGAIMDYQDSKLGGRYFASSPKYGYSIPDILAIARAYKIETAKIATHDGLAQKIRAVLNTKGPILCEVDMGLRTHVTLDP